MDKVAILMSTYNGAKYLREQIDSILFQKGVEVTLYIRDDGSSDGTIDIVKEYAQKYQNIIWTMGKMSVLVIVSCNLYMIVLMIMITMRFQIRMISGWKIS